MALPGEVWLLWAGPRAATSTLTRNSIGRLSRCGSAISGLIWWRLILLPSARQCPQPLLRIGCVHPYMPVIFHCNSSEETSRFMLYAVHIVSNRVTINRSAPGTQTSIESFSRLALSPVNGVTFLSHSAQTGQAAGPQPLAPPARDPRTLLLAQGHHASWAAKWHSSGVLSTLLFSWL